MPTKQDQIANTALNGLEYKAVYLQHVAKLMDEIKDRVMIAVEDRMNRENKFFKTTAFPRASFSLVSKLHIANRNTPSPEFEVTAGEGAPPLKSVSGDVDQYVEDLERKVDITNPNLSRIDAGLPFMQSVTSRPKPGEIFAKTVEEEIPIDPADYESTPRTPPVDVDKSDEFAAKLEIPAEKRMGRRKKGE